MTATSFTKGLQRSAIKLLDVEGLALRSRIFVVLSTFLLALEEVPVANPLTTWGGKLEPVSLC